MCGQPFAQRDHPLVSLNQRHMLKGRGYREGSPGRGSRARAEIEE
jgi:hypothetical protein